MQLAPPAAPRRGAARDRAAPGAPAAVPGFTERLHFQKGSCAPAAVGAGLPRCRQRCPGGRGAICLPGPPRSTIVQARALARPRSRPRGELTWTCSLACEFVFRPFPPCRVFRLIPQCQRCALGYQRAGSCLALCLPSPVHHARRLPGHAVNANQPPTQRGWGRGPLPLKSDPATRRRTPGPRLPGLLGAAEPAVRWPEGAVALAQGTRAMLCPWGGTRLSPGRCFPEPQRQTGVAPSFPSLQIPSLPPGHLLPRRVKGQEAFPWRSLGQAG